MCLTHRDAASPTGRHKMSFAPPHSDAPGEPGGYKDAKAHAKAAKAYAKAQRPWYKKKRIVLPLGLVWVVIAASAGSSGGGNSSTSSPSGIIQKPTMGRKPTRPKATSRMPRPTRIGLDCGRWK